MVISTVYGLAWVVGSLLCWFTGFVFVGVSLGLFLFIFFRLHFSFLRCEVRSVLVSCLFSGVFQSACRVRYRYFRLNVVQSNCWFLFSERAFDMRLGGAAVVHHISYVSLFIVVVVVIGDNLAQSSSAWLCRPCGEEGGAFVIFGVVIFGACSSRSRKMCLAGAGVWR